jgi:hypothetical protein
MPIMVILPSPVPNYMILIKTKFLNIIGVLFLYSCANATQGSNSPLYVGAWVLRVDAVVISFRDKPKKMLLVPNSKLVSQFLPGGYSDNEPPAIGQSSDRIVVHDVIASGSIIEVTSSRVEIHPSLGPKLRIYASLRSAVTRYDGVDVSLFEHYSNNRPSFRSEWLSRKTE